MAALVVVGVSPAGGLRSKETRIEIFPGGATPTMYAANTSFWVGYGFAADGDLDEGLDAEATRFELEVDGAGVPMRSDVHLEAGLASRKTDSAEFAEGLPAGWHDFVGRWYDGGRLILSSRAAIEFVER